MRFRKDQIVIFHDQSEEQFYPWHAYDGQSAVVEKVRSATCRIRFGDGHPMYAAHEELEAVPA